MMEIELECAKSGDTVIVLDSGYTHSKEHIIPNLCFEYDGYVNRISARKEGINVGLAHSADIIVSALANSYGLGFQQRGILRKAFANVEQYMGKSGDELKALAFSLRTLQCSEGEMLLERLRDFLQSGVLQRKSTQIIMKGKINIIELSELSEEVKQALMEILLSVCWAYIQRDNGNMGNVVLALDEFQNLPIGKNAIIRRMLREGRKFNVCFLLATQTLNTFSREEVSILNQAATRIYFRPPANEVGRIAREISPDNPSKWRGKLKTLKVGHYIVVGELSINGIAVNRPLLL